MRRAISFCAALATLCATGAPVAGAATHWVPPARLTWYWQLTGTPKVEPVQVTDFDGFDNSAATVASFHALGQRTICYINVGTAENWRADYRRFPTVDLGANNGWPGEQWLNITDPAIRPIMAARFTMCAAKGFDAVEPDNTDGWENSTGFNITGVQQEAYDEWVAATVHADGMAVFQKNDPEQTATLEPYFDGALDEQCNEYSECSALDPYVAAGKPVLNAEYQSSLYPSFCSADDAAGSMGALYDLSLDGATYQPCFGPIPPSPPIAGPAPIAGPSPPRETPSQRGLDQVAPRMTIAGRGLKAARGAVAVRLSCPKRQSYCDGTVELETVRRFALPGRSHPTVRAPLALGSRHFHIRGGRSGLVTVKLSKRTRQRLAGQKSIRVLVLLADRDAAHRSARSRRTVNLNLGRA